MEIHQIAATAATGVEHRHSLGDASAVELIEEVDVDVAELAAKILARLGHADNSLTAPARSAPLAAS
jgi:hypothetical protein